MVIYFKGTREIFGINLVEQRISPLLRELYAREMKNKRENAKFSRDQGTMLPPPSPPMEALFIDHITRALVYKQILSKKKIKRGILLIIFCKLLFILT